MIYVIDTSVILSDPRCLEKLSDKDIVIPLAVLSELESKRNHPDLGYPARNALRTLESFRNNYGSLTEAITRPEGGSLRVEVNNIDQSGLPEAFKSEGNDSRILAVAKNLSESNKVVLVSKDLPLRLKASVVGVNAEELYLESVDVTWPGMRVNPSLNEDIDSIYENGVISFESNDPINTCIIMKSDYKSALARKTEQGKLKLINETKVFGVEGRSAEQRFAIDMLIDPSIGIVSLAGSAGTGKSTLALAAGLESVVERNEKKKITIFRPIYPVGGQDIGFLPGTAEEKMQPWTQAIYDSLESFCDDSVIDHIMYNELLEVLPFTHIRGRTLTNSFVILEEAQNLDSMVLLTALTRIGRNSKVVLTHDVSQRDNLRVGRYDGVSSVISKLADNNLFGHITLKRTERSEIAELAARLLD